MMRRGVELGVEAGVRRGEMSLATIRSTPLARELLAAARDRIAALGGETDEHRPRRAAAGAPELGEDVGRPHERRVRSGRVGLLDLPGARAVAGV